MKVIGITGGIGSGKSLVTKIMKEKYGALVIDTDGIAREQMKYGGASYQEVVDCFGTEVLSDNMEIDRAKLSVLVFGDKEKRRKVNEITHPKVLTEVRKVIELHRIQEDVPYIIIETALMIEAGYDFVCDEVWYVYAPEEKRRDWLKQERGYTDEKIAAVIASQSKAEDFRRRFPRVIENVGTLAMLERQIEKLVLWKNS